MHRRLARLPYLLPAAIAFLALTATFAQALPASESDDTGMVNGPVRALVQSGNLLWVGGAFDQVLDRQGNAVQAAGGLAVFDAGTGIPITSIPLPTVTWSLGTATVYDMSLSPDGTLYLSGNFDAVNGVTRWNVAAIDPLTGALLPFAPRSEPSQAVYANGTVVYVGGVYLRAFRPNGTALSGWNSPMAWISPTLRGHTVYATFRDIVQMGGTLVTACVCDKIFDANHPSPDGVSVKAVVEVDATNGNLRSWFPSNLPLGPSGAPTFGESVIVHAAPDTGLATVYLGAGGNDYTAAYDFQTGQEIWKTDTSGSSQVVVWHQGTLIVGGHFEWTESPSTNACGDNDHPVTTCYGTPKLTAMNPVDGAVVLNPATSQPWNPAICCKYNGVWALVVSDNDSTLWVGGEFTRVGGTWAYDEGTNDWTQIQSVKQWYFAQLAAPAATVHPLSVVSADIGTGVGSVMSDVGGINCGSACADDFADGTVVTLTATAAAGFAFLGWSGDCTGVSPTCHVTMDRARNVTASFGVPTYTLTAARTGGGKGRVTSDIGGINCGSNANATVCSTSIVTGSSVTLTATATAGSVFTAWGGDCSGNDPTLPCVLTMDQAHNASVNFEIAKNVIVTLAGAGDGLVTSSPAGVSCPATCTAPFASGTVITLTAAPDVNSTFSGWSSTPTGLCSGTGTCQLTMSQQRTVTATFAPILHQLTAARAGDGGGAVESDVGGIDCGATCSASIQQGTLVTLTATPEAGSVFAGWSGDCTGTDATCEITIDADHSATATFKTLYTLSVVPGGTGGGLVNSDIGGISCGSTCSDQYASDTVVILTATPDAASTFDGWGGDCAGTDPCPVTMAQARDVTATFTQVYHELTVTPLGDGTGSITSEPAAIDCGTTCSAAIVQATTVTLTAVASPGDTFMGWGGDCSGIGTCVLNIDGDHSVSATFTPAHDLRITKAGGGEGTVSSEPEGIDCGSTCTWGFLQSTTVTLTAVPDVGSAFAGWSGDCSGMQDLCQIDMEGARGATATFEPVYHQLTTTPEGDGEGTITSDVGGIDCGSTCSVAVREPTDVTLIASPRAGSVFSGWGGDCSGVQDTCELTMGGDHIATATFTRLYELDVTRVGPGGGTVNSDLGAIDCGSTCADVYESGSIVTLTATPDANSSFTGWSGDASCPGTDPCQVLMSQARTVVATFAQIVHHVSVSTNGSGGTVTSMPAGIDCGSTCHAAFAQPTQVDLTATPATGWFFSGWGGDCNGTGTCRLTMTQDHAVSATFTQASGCGRILFTTKRTGNVDVWVMNANGSGQARLTTAAGSDIQPSWSPDCARIAFVSARTGSEQVYVMNANGTGVTQLTATGDNNQPTWSPSGGKIAFVSSRTGREKIFVMNANGTGVTQISDTSNASDTHPDWSPSGARIVFTSSRTGGNQVWVMNADGTAPVRLTKLLNACMDPTWSPDGTKVAIISKANGTRQVWTLNANGTGAVQVSASGKTDSQPTWSPDGTKIAYSTVASGHNQIWVVNANGTNAVNVSNTPSRDTLPNWS